jgi:hypothetical protein
MTAREQALLDALRSTVEVEREEAARAIRDGETRNPEVLHALAERTPKKRTSATRRAPRCAGSNGS